MSHSITRKTIAELLNGEEYLIPSYQRGYRWTTEQVDDLLNDFLDYAYDSAGDGFYCLQPVIVQKRNGTWELVDGQQRITTLVILLKALFAIEHYATESEFSEGYAKKHPMKISFGTHSEDEEFLENISSKTSADVANINQAHMLAAFEEIMRWFRQEAPGRCGENSIRRIAQKFLDLLAVDGSAKSVQVIWYQLDDSEAVNPIREFLRINSGKIPLTDTELVKALLLQKKSFHGDETKQIQHALEWENMENSLTRPAFWSMVSANPDETDRMRVVLDLIYRTNHDGRGAREKGDLFRFFADMAEGGRIQSVWRTITDRFRMLETWFEDPLVYNFAGLLSHLGASAYDMEERYDRLPPDAERKDFVKELVDKVQGILGNVPVGEDGKILLSYDKNRKSIRDLLLFVNVMQSVHRIEESELAGERGTGNAGFFKFPFDLFDAQKWNVEHVDSATPNSMKRDDDKAAWIKTARECFPDLASDAKAVELDRNGQVDELINYIRNAFDCGDEPSDVKDGVGNLVLLDEVTNKSYGNHVFAVKADVIRKKLHRGVFVPICTQWVFEKSLDGCNHGAMLKWDGKDKSAYHDFISRELRDFMARS